MWKHCTFLYEGLEHLYEISSRVLYRYKGLLYMFLRPSSDFFVKCLFSGIIFNIFTAHVFFITVNVHKT